MGALYWSVSPLPSPDELEDVRSRLARVFSAEENRPYLTALAEERTPPRVAAARLGALSLLPDLMARGGIDPATVILQRDAEGRPYGVSSTEGDMPFDFNLSHSDRHGLCALLIGGGRVGVDVEEVIPPRRALPLIRRYCTEGEQALLEPLSDEEKALAFTRIWTVREALGKQEGRGMPLRYDATAIPRGICVITGRIAETGTCLSLCYPCDADSEMPVQISRETVLWESAESVTELIK